MLTEHDLLDEHLRESAFAYPTYSALELRVYLFVDRRHSLQITDISAPTKGTWRLIVLEEQKGEYSNTRILDPVNGKGCSFDSAR